MLGRPDGGTRPHSVHIGNNLEHLNQVGEPFYCTALLVESGSNPDGLPRFGCLAGSPVHWDIVLDTRF